AASAVRLGSPSAACAARLQSRVFRLRGLPTMFDRTQSTIAQVDPEIWSAIQRENQRQEEHIELIASENYASPAVMAAQGSQLTHGMPLNMSGKWFKVVSYGLDANEAIDYDAMERLAHEHRPKLIIAGASAYSLRIDFERFAKVAKDIGAYFMVDMAHYAGLI